MLFIGLIKLSTLYKKLQVSPIEQEEQIYIPEGVVSSNYDNDCYLSWCLWGKLLSWSCSSYHAEVLIDGAGIGYHYRTSGWNFSKNRGKVI